jgi:tRNA G46 methylase TrmB
MESTKYVHGYSGREAMRLNDQADTLDEIIHNDSFFEPGSIVLEAGCGVGAQTKIIAQKNSEAIFVCIDLSRESLGEANQLIQSLNITNVEFK